jgi:hypothetical protein
LCILNKKYIYIDILIVYKSHDLFHNQKETPRAFSVIVDCPKIISITQCPERVFRASDCQKSLFDSLPYKNPTSKKLDFSGFIEREGGFLPPSHFPRYSVT